MATRRWRLLGVLAVVLAVWGCAPQPARGPDVDLTAAVPGGEPPVLPRLRRAGPALGPEAPYVALMDPPVVQRVWIPASLNRHGDLVSGYWIYLTVHEAGFFLKREDERPLPP